MTRCCLVELSVPVELSVIVPVFNGRRYLRSAVRSLLSEKISEVVSEVEQKIEIVVVDDASTDNCLSVISDLPVRVIRLEKRQGQAAAQNHGLRLAKGTYVTFLDSDDLLARGGLTQRLLVLKKNPQWPVVVGEVAGVIGSCDEGIGSYADVILPRYAPPDGLIDSAYLNNGGQFPSFAWLMMMKRRWLLECGGFDESYQCAHDNDLFHRIVSKQPIPFLPIPVAFYRLHEQNMSGGFRGGQFFYSSIAKTETLFVHLKHGVAFDAVKKEKAHEP